MTISDLHQNPSGASLFTGTLKEGYIKNCGDLTSGVKDLGPVVANFFNTIEHLIAPVMAPARSLRT